MKCLSLFLQKMLLKTLFSIFITRHVYLRRNSEGGPVKRIGLGYALPQMGWLMLVPPCPR
jgi:hypothetical protein